MLFDLDGVLADTLGAHRRAWRDLFEHYFAAHLVTPAYCEEDYTLHVDGLPRSLGVAQVLASRGITLPPGLPTDPPEAETIEGLGRRKNLAFLAAITDDGVAPYPETLGVLGRLAGQGLAMGVVSSSANARQVLKVAGIEAFFPVVVDGLLAAKLRLAPKPAPDTFLHASALLGAHPARTIVVEDALAGVGAGRAGAFALVVGVDRGAGAKALEAAGADIVVTSLADIPAP